MVAFGTGARPGELAALKRGDLDLRNARFRSRATRSRGLEGSPKTKSSVRDVDCLPPVLAAGEDPQWVARMLGHKGVQILYRVYARWIVNRTHQDGPAPAGRLGSLSVTPGEEVLTDRPGGGAHRGADADETRTIARAARGARARLREVSSESVAIGEIGAEGGIRSIDQQ